MLLRRYDVAGPTKAQRRAFSCGVPSLDAWLATRAGQSARTRDAVTYLLLDDDGPDPPEWAIAGYFCLSAGQVSRAAASPVVARRAPEPVPVIRMGRLAVASSYAGQGWGAELLREALLSAASAATAVGARALLVDALDDAAAGFHRRFGFTPSPIDPLVLMHTIGDIAASAGLPRG